MIKKASITFKCNPSWAKHNSQQLSNVDTRQILLQSPKVAYWIGGAFV